MESVRDIPVRQRLRTAAVSLRLISVRLVLSSTMIFSLAWLLGLLN
jgi:hypothetical protein